MLSTLTNTLSLGTARVSTRVSIYAAIGALLAMPMLEADAQARTPDVIFVPTPQPVVDAMLDVAKVGKNDTIFDLGSGDGRIVITAAKRFGTRGYGIDIDPKRIEESNIKLKKAGVGNLVEFREADLFETDLRSASVVTLYLLPELNVRLRPKLFQELKPGTRVVSHAFDMDEWEADSTFTVNSNTVYFWVIPAKFDGQWSMTITPNDGSESTETVTLKQEFQKVSGTSPSIAGMLRGKQVEFTMGNHPEWVFTGAVEGKNAMGAYKTKDGKEVGTWKAVKR